MLSFLKLLLLNQLTKKCCLNEHDHIVQRRATLLLRDVKPIPFLINDSQQIYATGWGNLGVYKTAPFRGILKLRLVHIHVNS